MEDVDRKQNITELDLVHHWYSKIRFLPKVDVPRLKQQQIKSKFAGCVANNLACLHNKATITSPEYCPTTKIFHCYLATRDAGTLDRAHFYEGKILQN